MRQRFGVIPIICFVCVTAGLGCSNSPMTESALLPDEHQGKLAEPLVSGAPWKSEFDGTWTRATNNQILSIKKQGSKGPYRLHNKSNNGEWEGRGHRRGDELIVVFWYLHHIDPANTDRHGYVTMTLDGEKTLDWTSYNSDGTLAFTGTLSK